MQFGFIIKYEAVLRAGINTKSMTNNLLILYMLCTDKSYIVFFSKKVGSNIGKIAPLRNVPRN
jgi:hypothetical protein